MRQTFDGPAPNPPPNYNDRRMPFRQKPLVAMEENASLLAIGLAAGAGCAAVAVAPAVHLRGGRLPTASVAALLGLVLATGAAINGQAGCWVQRQSR